MASAKISLLVSAHDPAAAHAISGVLKAASQDRRFKIKTVAHGPALKIFQENGVKVKAVDIPRVTSDADANVRLLLNRVDEVIEEASPDVILTGLSGPDAGIDEALTVIAKGKIPIVALQDFWGDINPVFNQAADYYLVADKLASQLTAGRVKANIIEVGMPHYSSIPDLPDRSSIRKKLDLPDSVISVIWFGQPLWDTPAYAKTLLSVAEVLKDTDKEIRLFFKPHPRESAEEMKEAVSLLSTSTLDVHVVNDYDNTELLVSADIVASAYSMIAMDLLQYQRKSKEPLAVPVYFLADKTFMDYYTHYTGLDSFPLVEQGLVLSAIGQEQMQDTILKVVKPKYKNRIWNNAKETLPDPEQSINKVLNTIASIK